MFAAPPITEHQPQSWTYEHRHRLTERVARLDAGSLRRVLVLVFGDANGFRPRDEFTIDFEGLDRGVCATLDAFLDDVSSDAAYKRARRAVGLPEAEPPAPELPPRPLPPRPRGLDPPIVVRVPAAAGISLRRETLLRPAGAITWSISITTDGAGRRVVVAAVVADGRYCARAASLGKAATRRGPRPTTRRRRRRPSWRKSLRKTTTSLMEAPGRRRAQARVRPPPKISYSGRFCPRAAGELLTHAPAAIAHGKTRKDGNGAPPLPPAGPQTRTGAALDRQRETPNSFH